MDKEDEATERRIAQKRGAIDHRHGFRYSPRDWHTDAILMYAHGYRTGHRSCDCQVLHGSRDVNAQVIVV